MIDKLVIVLSTELITSKPYGAIFNDGRARLSGSWTDGYILKVKHGHICVRYLTFVLNEMARFALAKKVDNPIALSRSRFAHKRNFIPCGFRRYLAKHGPPLSTIRAQVIKEVMSSLADSKIQMANDTSAAFNVPYSAEDIRTTIKMCEIDFDLVHQPTTQITRIPKVIRGFNQAADEVELGYFDKKGEFRARKRQSSVARLKSFSNKDAIRAYVREGDAWVEFFLYQKEDGELGALNRCESRFDQTALENLFKSRQFNSESEFVAKIDHLSEISFKRLYPILSFVAKNELKDWTMLRQALRMLFRNCAEEVYELLRHEGRVSTGSASNRTPKSAKLRIPKFAKFGIVFQKVNASIYRVDWKSLPHFSERFFEFKASNSKKKFVEPAATPFIIKHEKSWATTNFG